MAPMKAQRSKLKAHNRGGEFLLRSGSQSSMLKSQSYTKSVINLTPVETSGKRVSFSVSPGDGC
jgi:hypothetical protein